MVEGHDIWLLYVGPTPNTHEPILVAIRLHPDDKEGDGEKIVELHETSEISNVRTPTTAMPAMWDEWDM